MDNNNNYNLPNPDETVNNKVNNNQYNYPPAYNMPQQPIEQDKVNVGLCILGWLIPLFALIYFLTKKQEKPKGAKAVGIVGLVSIILNIIVIIVTFAFTGSILNKTLDTVDKAIDSDIVEEYQGDWDSFISSYGDNEDTTYSNTNDTTNKNSQVITGNTTSNWKDYKVIVNGATIQLPIKYSEFEEKTGYKFKDIADAQQTLKSDYITTATMSYNDYNIVASFINDDVQPTTLDNCYIVSLNISEYNGDKSIKFTNDLSIGTNITKEKAIEMFGNPDYVYDEENYQNLKFKEADSIYNKFEITIKDNVIIDISTECVDVK